MEHKTKHIDLVKAFESIGYQLENFDWEEGDDMDPCDDLVWQSLLPRITAGNFAAVLAMPPCRTFRPGCRTAGDREIYGLRQLEDGVAEDRLLREEGLAKHGHGARVLIKEAIYLRNRYMLTMALGIDY